MKRDETLPSDSYNDDTDIKEAFTEMDREFPDISDSLLKELEREKAKELDKLEMELLGKTLKAMILGLILDVAGMGFEFLGLIKQMVFPCVIGGNLILAAIIIGCMGLFSITHSKKIAHKFYMKKIKQIEGDQKREK
jgi:hypothetical protein